MSRGILVSQASLMGGFFCWLECFVTAKIFFI